MEPKDTKFYFRKRYLVVFFVFLGAALEFALKMNLSIVLVDITRSKNITAENRTTFEKAEVDWNSKQIGFILGASAYGQIPTIFAAGILARKFGGATIFFFGLFSSSLMTLITPVLIHLNFWLFAFVRICEGIGFGLIAGSAMEVYLNWSPREERSRHTIAQASGSIFGIICCNIISSLIIHFYGWKAVFYTTGGIGLGFSFLWFVLISNRPLDDKFISKREREYLKAKIIVPSDTNTSIFSYPWKRIITSRPVWAYVNDVFCGGWSATFISSSLPLYIKDMCNTDVRNVAFLSSIPLFCSLISEFTFSYVSDYIRSSGILSVSKMHQIFVTVPHIGIALCLVAIATWANFESSLVLISIMRILFGIETIPYSVLPIDSFFRYASIIKSFGLICLSLASSFSPLLMGFIVTNHERSQWNLYFELLVVFNIWSVLVFGLYGSGELQSWAAPPGKTKRTEIEQKSENQRCSAKESQLQF